MTDKKLHTFFKKENTGQARIAIFLSGSGTNAEKILQMWKENPEECGFVPSCLVSDRECRAEELAREFGLKHISLNIREFYKKRGLNSISLASAEGRETRQAWTEELWKLIEPLNCDFGVFAGFIPLTNITDHLPCLNVHPGDLTYLDSSGNRLLVGLHTIPVEAAILEKLDYMRSTVILASAYNSRSGAGMDEGIILGVSAPVDIDFNGHTPDQLHALAQKRAEKKPKGGWQDKLESIAEENQEKLKVNGDWIVFPQCLSDFSKGLFVQDDTGQLHVKCGEKYIAAQCVEYAPNQKTIFFKAD